MFAQCKSTFIFTHKLFKESSIINSTNLPSHYWKKKGHLPREYWRTASDGIFSLMADRLLSKRAAVVDNVHNFVAEWRFPTEWHLPSQERQMNVKPVKRSFKSVNLCKFMAWCPDVLADKRHPRFDTKILSKKVWLIRRCLRFISHSLTHSLTHSSIDLFTT